MKNEPQIGKKKTAILLGCYFLALIFLYSFVKQQGYVKSFEVTQLRYFVFPFCALTSALLLLVINNIKISFLFLLVLQAVGTLFERAQFFVVLPLLCCLWLLKWAGQAQLKEKAAVAGIQLFAAVFGVMANVSGDTQYGLLPFSAEQVPFAVLAALCLLLAAVAVLLPQKSAPKKKKKQADFESMFLWLGFGNALVLANTVWHFVSGEQDTLFRSFSVCFWFVYTVCFGYFYVRQNRQSALVKKIEKLL
ncbi:MAG: hypothetical protein IJI67_05435 [Clostridia bacterium]|nr:hypothetical protein [Clostridia bacterium]